jgi:probable F420-dependent oxidoreductase
MKAIRFGIGASSKTYDELVAEARLVEAAGFATFSMADHFALPLAPLLGLQAAASATTTLRLTTTVLAHDFRHPAVLAKELSTLDVLSGGRLEIGIGAGWLQAEYAQAGIEFDRPSARIARLEEYVQVLRGLMADEPLTHVGPQFRITGLNGTPKPIQRPHPPIMIGGGGPKILSLAGRIADIVSVIPTPNPAGGLGISPAELSADRLHERLRWVSEGAGDRHELLELSIALLGVRVAENPQDGADDLARFWSSMGFSAEGILDSPCFATGTLDDVCEQLFATRERFGVSYFSVAFPRSSSVMPPIIEALRGR